MARLNKKRFLQTNIGKTYVEMVKGCMFMKAYLKMCEKAEEECTDEEEKKLVERYKSDAALHAEIYAEKCRTYSFVIKELYGIRYIAIDDGEYFGIATPDRKDWLVKYKNEYEAEMALG